MFTCVAIPQLVRLFSEADLEGREPLPEKNFFLTNSPSFIEHRFNSISLLIFLVEPQHFATAQTMATGNVHQRTCALSCDCP